MRLAFCLSAAIIAGCAAHDVPSIAQALAPSAISPLRESALSASKFSGETFSAKKINSVCFIDGYSGFWSWNLSYYVAGKSSGPYPGTFVAKGTGGIGLRTASRSYTYGFNEEFKIRSHRREIYGVVKSRREFSLQECSGYNVVDFQITGARYRAHSSGRTDVTLTPQSFSESFH